MKKTGNERKDKYYALAKKQGYRARSSFKLLEIDKKYDFLSKASVVVDLCAAPGGWMQVATERAQKNSIVIGVDLVSIKKIPGTKTIVSDITSENCLMEIKKLLGDKKADVFLHDGAPNVGTSWIQDAYNQNELVIFSLKLATSFLKKGGIFITKVFRSKDYDCLLWLFKKMFSSVGAFKPVSSRDVSAEIFVICQDYLCPEKIDSNFFEPERIFEEMKVSISKKRKGNKTNREGYKEEKSIIYEECTADDFIKKELLLEDYNKILFTNSEAKIMENKYTTQEIIECCKDLKVLSKLDLKRINNWRKRIRKEFGLDEVVKEKNEKEKVERTDEEIIKQKIEKEEIRLKRKEEKKKEKIARQLYGKNYQEIDHEEVPKIIDTLRQEEFNQQTESEEESDKEELFALEKIEKELEKDYEERKEKKKKVFQEKKEENKFLLEDANKILSKKENSILKVPKEEIKHKIEESDSDSDDSVPERELTEQEIAIGVKLMTKKGLKELKDKSLNRYTFDDELDLPVWFLDDIEKYEQRPLEIEEETREIIKEKKDKINKKVRKKEIEAITRKKKRWLKKEKSVRERMNKALGDDLNENEKITKIVKLSKELKREKRRKKNIVIMRKGGAVGKRGNKNGKILMLDRRMKCDLRKKKLRNKKKS